MKHLPDGGIGLDSDTLLVIKLPDSQVLRVVSRSVFLAVFILTLPCIGSILKGLSSTSNYSLPANDSDSDYIDVEFLDSLLLDLANEGLIKKGDKALFVKSGIGAVIDNSRFLNANEIDLAKKAALNGLEDVLLEPPRKVLATSRKFLKKFNYLPDFLEDSLEGYPRRVFVDVSLQEEKDSVMAWFNENYPTRNQKFETYNIEMVPEVVSKTVARRVNVSNWLLKNVRQDEFVVMKAEAEVVEEMIRRGLSIWWTNYFYSARTSGRMVKRRRARGLIGSV
ncbi:hypothetical protein GH714_008016 [Hevea brasiliensis]|uniref:DUF7870 domain-containing protein n=1 Tax=Hevea brasiliensis TaxID=3981 RepID=A0A6A6L075_HEVBR|nr:hypothetical protein GH714_008016 [Hevea brasiliensis]